jgi:hypothetical protein
MFGEAVHTPLTRTQSWVLIRPSTVPRVPNLEVITPSTPWRTRAALVGLSSTPG